MKLKNVTLKDGKPANLNLKREDKTYLPGEEFEVSDERGKELLKLEIDDKPIVEKVKEAKPQRADKPQEQDNNTEEN